LNFTGVLLLEMVSTLHFTDDTIAYLVIKSNSDALTLQRDLDKLAQWEQLWKIAFHPDKCNVLTISSNKTPVKFKYCLHDHVLESVDKAKYLGVSKHVTESILGV
jgi:hypothetical protein